MIKGLTRTHYFLAVLSIIFVDLFIVHVSGFIGRSSTYLILIILVALNVWYGGLRLGFFTILVSVLHTIIYFLIPQKSGSVLFFSSIYEVGLFILAGSIITVFIEKYKKTDIVSLHLKKEDEFRRRIKVLESDVMKMEKEVKMRDEFLSIASHELKTPLTSMLIKIQMILHNIRNVSLANFSVENLMQQLETAEQQTKRLSQMINDLQNVSLITTGRMRLEKEKVDLSNVVKEVTNEFTERLQRDSIKLVFHGEKPVYAFIDKVRIQQVITNLITNAIKYGRKNPISVDVTGNEEIATVMVEDHGIGIHPNYRDKIFSLFERGVTEKDIEGLGVGLYIANQIIRAHGGKIVVSSKPGNGSTFTIEIPAK